MAVNVRGPGQNVCDGARGRGREVYFRAPGSESERGKRNAVILSRYTRRDFITARERLSFYFCVARGEVIEYPGSFQASAGGSRSGSSALRPFQINDPGFQIEELRLHGIKLLRGGGIDVGDIGFDLAHTDAG